MMMSSTNRKILIVLVVVDILLALVSVIFFDMKVLFNTQIGYITATLVMVASIVSYRRMVNARVKHNIVTMDDSKDTIDKLEDPYDLYSEDVVENEEKDFSATVKEEKKKLKENRRTVYQTIKDTKAALSIYRLSAYALLILGFLYLNRQGLLHIPSYIISLGIPSVILVWVLLKEKENHSQD
jgi:ABC-type transport system involved in cytochrome bd biosynthesis fused ATPase/permease subunit